MIKTALKATMFIIIVSISIRAFSRNSKLSLEQNKHSDPYPAPRMSIEEQSYKFDKDSEVIIDRVPAYTFRHGCGPTSVGMVIGYYDCSGYDLIPGDASHRTQQVKQAIASSGDSMNPQHYEDYCEPRDDRMSPIPDKSEPPIGDEHTNNCIADFMRCSWSAENCSYGEAYYTFIGPSFVDYVNMVAPVYEPTYINYLMNDFTWNIFKNEINSDYPMVFMVDMDGNAETDHIVTAVGYRESGSVHEYGCYDTGSESIHWETFRTMAAGCPWGIFLGVAFHLVDTIHVDDNGPNDPAPCDTSVSDPMENGTAQHPYDSIQEAIDTSVNGDKVVVSEGIYYGTGNLNIEFHGKAITLTSASGAGSTIIDCQNSGCGFLFRSSETQTTILEGFTIRHGQRSNGGGIYCQQSSPLITDCIIVNNTCTNDGGGIQCLMASPQITNCIISHNSGPETGYGGGFNCSSTSYPTITNCIIENNSNANIGGGVCCSNNSELTIINCTITSNHSDAGGGASVWYNSTMTIVDSIIWGNSAINGSQLSVGSSTIPSTLSISYSDVEGAQSGVWVRAGCQLNWGAGMINSNPLFVPSLFGDFYLSQTATGQPVNSLCVDGGSGMANETCFPIMIGESCMNDCWTRTDSDTDTYIIDLGAHYPLPARPDHGPPDSAKIEVGPTGSNHIELQILDGNTGYETFLLDQETELSTGSLELQRFQFIDWNTDSTTDLGLIDTIGTKSGHTEIHVLDGSTNFMTLIADNETLWATGDLTREVFQFVDWNNDGIQDLAVIVTSQTGSGKTEIHVMNGATTYSSFLAQVVTILDYGDLTKHMFQLIDWNDDGVLDLGFLNIEGPTGSGHLELHVLNGASLFTTFLLHLGTQLPYGDLNIERYQLVDWNRDNVEELAVFHVSGTSSGKIEFDIYDGTTLFVTNLSDTTTSFDCGELSHQDYKMMQWSAPAQATRTPSPPITSTPTSTPTEIFTPMGTPSEIPTVTPEPTTTNSPTMTVTQTPTIELTATPTVINTATPTATMTPVIVPAQGTISVLFAIIILTLGFVFHGKKRS